LYEGSVLAIGFADIRISFSGKIIVTGSTMKKWLKAVSAL